MRVTSALLLMLLLAACSSSKPAPDPEPEPEPASSAKPPALKTLQGDTAPWDSVRGDGKRTLLVFSTLWCQACQEEQPAVEAYAKARERDLRVVYVIAGTELERAQEMAAERKYAVPAYVDTDGSFSDYFGVEVTPTLITFDRDGKQTGTYDSIDALPPDSESALPSEPEAVVDSGQEIGTTYDVVVMATDIEKARADLAAAREVVREAELHMSEWKYDTDLSRLNREGGSGPVEVPADLLQVITGSIKVSKATGGAFDITWLPLKQVWKDAADAGHLPSDETIATTLECIGSDKIVIEGSTVRFTHPDTKIGLGAVAKGWIVDAVFLHLREAGYDNLIVNIGGDLRTAGEGPDGPWTFQIMDPYEPSKVAGTFNLTDGAVATSGQYLRYVEIEGKRYGHIMDPRTGWPASFDGSVSAFAPDCAMADALATALFVMGPDEGLAWVKKNPGTEVIYATRQGLQSSID